MMSIDTMITQLNLIKKRSQFGGNTQVVVCIPDSEMEYICNVTLRMEKDDDGCLAVVNAKPNLYGDKEANKMKYKVAIWWSESAEVEVEAESLDEAIEMVQSGNVDFPEHGDYIDDSTEINHEYTREINND